MDIKEDVFQKKTYDAQTNSIITRHIYDPSAVLRQNKEERESVSSKDPIKYKGKTLVHAGSIHMGDITRLKTLGYDLLSADPDEVRRGLCYIQTNEPHLLTVSGKPFARTRKVWA